MTTSGAENPDPPAPAAGSEGEPTPAAGLALPSTAGPAAWDEFGSRPTTDRRSLTPSIPVAIAATALLIGAAACVIAFFAIRGPVDRLAGSPQPNAELIRQEPIPTIDTPPPVPTSEPRPSSTTQPSQPPATVTVPAAPLDAMAVLAGHPLSTSDATMPTTACSLSRFDPVDDRQAVFFQEAKVCADTAWSAVFTAAGLPMPAIQVVIVHSGPTNTPCGTVSPTDRPTQCGATIYMTPAYLRDVEQNGRFPGRYFGVFLLQYAKAVQDASGLTILYNAVRSQPGASVADLDARFGQQATCLAGMASGAMAGQGSVDTNITGEIHDRLSTVDAPADAAGWLDKGFQARTLSSCNSWSATP